MQSEEILKNIIEQNNRTIKALIAEIAEIREKKRRFQSMLRDLRWEKRMAKRRAA